jgi:hypothetical protein
MHKETRGIIHGNTLAKRGHLGAEDSEKKQNWVARAIHSETLATSEIMPVFNL